METGEEYRKAIRSFEPALNRRKIVYDFFAWGPLISPAKSGTEALAMLYPATLLSAHSVIPANAGIQEGTGFRVKPGMTNGKGLMVPD